MTMTTTPSTKPAFDVVGFIMDYEDGDMTPDDAIQGFQALIDSGMVWSLQGHYGRTATRLIEQGLCHPATE